MTSSTLRLRRWQRDALISLESARPRDFLACVVPGGGKTTWALTAALRHLREYPHRPVIVTVPTASLKVQWARSASRFGLQLDPAWDGRPRIRPEMHGIVLTYAQVASATAALCHVADDCVAVMDEHHHVGSDRTWGDALEAALGNAGLRIALTGTPWRGDDNPIPFATYDAEGELVPDYTYSYADALADGGVVRPVMFPRIGGTMDWRASTGDEITATFTEALTKDLMAQRLRTALHADGGWVRSAITQAWSLLTKVRREDPEAAAILFCIDQNHARAIARVWTKITGDTPVVAVSDDPDAHDKLEAFAAGHGTCAITVRQASEGYDAPRARVGVWLTNVTQPLFFAQAVGRVQRWRPELGDRQPAWVFLPDDIRLVALAHGLVEQRTHTLKKRDEEPDDRAERAERDPEQVSLFAALGSQAEEPQDPDAAIDQAWTPGPRVPVRMADDPALEIDLPPPPRRHTATAVDDRPAFDVLADLRARNSDVVRALARHTGLGHREVNSTLNKEAGIHRIGDATAAQLRRRMEIANRWLKSA